ncbi:30S ribosomal protein S16 [Penaeicola halotolerans]|uniref:30S ribosomal protein S16 n=1 Tax=Penaeicola halotolerans TaxID=2793196 RepID=UPI001CF80D5D|nr:30S ribosomal protein S16 [Penaeicola halotolerans]
MSVKIRLARRGKKRKPFYDVVVADARAPRDGKFIEKIGSYNPNTNPATIEINDDKALTWVLNGAQPTDTVKAMLSYRGVLLKKHLQIGVLKGAITQEQADAKFEEWKASKDSKISGKVEGLAKAKQDAKKAALDAEAKKNAARLEAIAAKQKEAEAAAAETAEEPTAESAEGEAPAAEDNTEEQN